MSEKARKPKLSVVIPVYNVKEYLAECLDSILGQDFEDFEVILVDNKSTDGSYELCEEYARENPGKVWVYQCEKWGAAAVRNYGAERARGKYLWFIDSDDYIEQGAMRKLVETAEVDGADAVVMAVRRVYEDGHDDILTAVDTTKEGWKNRYVMYGLAPYQNLYRREFWAEHFEFPEGMIHEDMAIMSTAVLYTDKIAFVEEPLYNYRQRAGSVLHQGEWNPHALDIFKALGILYGKFNAAGKLEEYRDALEYFFIWNLLIDSAKDFYVGASVRGSRERISGMGSQERSSARGSRERVSVRGSQERMEKMMGQKQSRAVLKEVFPRWWKNRFFRRKPLKFRLNCYRGYLGLLK